MVPVGRLRDGDVVVAHRFTAHPGQPSRFGVAAGTTRADSQSLVTQPGGVGDPQLDDEPEPAQQRGVVPDRRATRSWKSGSGGASFGMAAPSVGRAWYGDADSGRS